MTALSISQHSHISPLWKLQTFLSDTNSSGSALRKDSLFSTPVQCLPAISCFNMFEYTLKLLLSHIKEASICNLRQNKLGVPNQQRKNAWVKKSGPHCQVSLKERVQPSHKQRVPSTGKTQMGYKIQHRSHNRGIWNRGWYQTQA